MWIWKLLSSFQNTLRLFISPIANVNDRSMLGCRDSEIAVYVQDNAMVRIFGLIKKERKKVHWNKKEFEWIILVFSWNTCLSYTPPTMSFCWEEQTLWYLLQCGILWKFASCQMSNILMKTAGKFPVKDR